MTTPYPSIPVPKEDIKSLLKAFLSARQVINLLAVNIQAPSAATLSKASQIFATPEHVAQVVKTAAPGKQGPQGPKGDKGDPGGQGAPGGGGFPDAPNDGNSYGRKNFTWVTPAVLAATIAEAASDADAAAAGVPVGGVYKNGHTLMVRLT